eukprot:292680_1
MLNNLNICRYFGSAKGCNVGPGCRFSHDNPQSIPICKYINSNTCKYGNECKFRHDTFNKQKKYTKTSIKHRKIQNEKIDNINIGNTGYQLVYIGQQIPKTEVDIYKKMEDTYFQSQIAIEDYINNSQIMISYNHKDITINHPNIKSDLGLPDEQQYVISTNFANPYSMYTFRVMNDKNDIFIQIWYYKECKLHSKIFHHKLNKENKKYEILKSHTISIDVNEQIIQWGRDAIQYKCQFVEDCVLIVSNDNKYLMSHSQISHFGLYQEIYYNIYYIDKDCKLKLISKNVKDFTTTTHYNNVQFFQMNKWISWMSNNNTNLCIVLNIFEKHDGCKSEECIHCKYRIGNRKNGLYVLTSQYFCHDKRDILNEYVLSSITDVIMSFIYNPFDICNGIPQYIEIQIPFSADISNIYGEDDLLYIWHNDDVSRCYQIKRK